MNIREFRSYMRKNELEDQWWIAIEGQKLENPIKLTDILMRKSTLKNKRVSLCHVTDSQNGGKIVWQSVDFSDGIVLRNKEPLTSGGILQQSLDEFKDIKSKLVGSGSSEFIEAIYAKFGEERQALLELEKKLEALREELYIKEQDLLRREQYVEECESILIDKASHQEQKQAELDQVLEDMKLSE